VEHPELRVFVLAWSRELGLALTRAAEAKGYIGRDMAFKLGWSASKVSPRRDELLRLARNAYAPSWWQEYGERLPADLTTLSDHEDAAVTITHFEAIIVPGLLQTEAYTRALLTSNPVVPKNEIEDRILLRLRRQNIFGGRLPAYRG
jgi:Domain of unknown function (DUF5753)